MPTHDKNSFFLLQHEMMEVVVVAE